MTPSLIIEGHDLALGVDSAANVSQMRRAVVVPAELVLTAELKANRLAELLRHDSRRLLHVPVATAPEGVRTRVVLHPDLFEGQTEDLGQTDACLIDPLIGAHDESAVL